MTRTSIVSMPGMCRGRSRSVAGSVLGLVQAGNLDDQLFHCADQFLDDAVPGDQPRALVAGVAQTRRQRPIGGEPIHGRRQRFRRGSHDEAVHAVLDELERAAGIGRRDHGLAREKRLERDVAVVFVERAVNDGERAFVQIDERLLVDRPRKGRCDRTSRAMPPAASVRARCVPSPTMTSRIGRSTCCMARTARSGRLIDSRRPDKQHVVAIGPGLEPIGERRRWIQRIVLQAVELRQAIGDRAVRS